MLRDSSGLVIPSDPAVDPPLIVVRTDGIGANGPSPDPIDEDCVFKYSAREFLSDAPTFKPTMSPGAMALYQANALSCLNGEIEGTLLGLVEGGGGMVFGAIVGMTFANQQFWISPPDTCGCQGAVPAPPDVMATRPPSMHAQPAALKRRDVLPGAGRIAASRDPNGARIAFWLNAPARVGIRVLDVQGREIADLGTMDAAPGENLTRWDYNDRSGGRAPSGVYFVRLRAVAPNGAVRELSTRLIIAR